MRKKRDRLLDTPTYTVSEVAGFLYMPVATLRTWVVGRDYPTALGTQRFRPLIRIVGERPTLLSFTNVVEVHVLSAIRRKHQVQLAKVRSALDYLENRLETTRPLAEKVPIRLYPFTRCRDFDEPKPVTIDPGVAFGRPVLSGTGIPTEVVVERFNAGESIAELAQDYERESGEIEEAIRFERHAAAA